MDHPNIALMANLASFIILVLFLYGRSLRKTNTSRHVKVMTTVIVADIALVIGLVLMRDALGQVSSEMNWALKIHVPIAISTVVLYLGAFYTGYQLVKGRKEYLNSMRWIDRFVTPMRILTFLTSCIVQFAK